MHDIKKIIQNKEFYITNLKQRNYISASESINNLISLQGKLSKLYLELSNSKSNKDKKTIIKEINLIKAEIQTQMYKIPNICEISSSDTFTIVSENKNKYILTSNKETYYDIVKIFNFINSNAVNLYGSKFIEYQNDAVLIINALKNYFLCYVKSNKYKILNSPVLVPKLFLYNCGQLPKFKDDLYFLGSDCYLSPTGEIQLMNYHENKILFDNDLPVKLSCYSLCFRKEAGSHGKKNKPILRQHQFNKVEIVRLFNPKHSDTHFNEMIAEISQLLESLQLNYRVIKLHQSDIAFSAYKTYDFEVFFKNTGWVEVSSLSLCLDYQTRRTRTRIKNLDGTKYFPYSANGSCLAIDRIFAALIENNFSDDFIKLPKVLKKYFYDYKLLTKIKF